MPAAGHVKDDGADKTKRVAKDESIRLLYVLSELRRARGRVCEDRKYDKNDEDGTDRQRAFDA